MRLGDAAASAALPVVPLPSLHDPLPSPSGPKSSPVPMTSASVGKPCALHCPLARSLCPSPFVGLCFLKPHPTTLSTSIPKNLPFPHAKKALAGTCPGESRSCNVDCTGTTPLSPSWGCFGPTHSPYTLCFSAPRSFPRLEPINNPGASPPDWLRAPVPSFVSERAVRSCQPDLQPPDTGSFGMSLQH